MNWNKSVKSGLIAVKGFNAANDQACSLTPSNWLVPVWMWKLPALRKKHFLPSWFEEHCFVYRGRQIWHQAPHRVRQTQRVNPARVASSTPGEISDSNRNRSECIHNTCWVQGAAWSDTPRHSWSAGSTYVYCYTLITPLNVVYLYMEYITYEHAAHF